MRYLFMIALLSITGCKTSDIIKDAEDIISQVRCIEEGAKNVPCADIEALIERCKP